MDAIYHLVLPSVWQAAGPVYRAASLDQEGFIHCSFAHQVSWAANKFYAMANDLLVLQIDPARLSSPVKVESAGSAGDFPHIYGPIERTAVQAVHSLQRTDAGQWVFDVPLDS